MCQTTFLIDFQYYDRFFDNDGGCTFLLYVLSYLSQDNLLIRMGFILFLTVGA